MMRKSGSPTYPDRTKAAQIATYSTFAAAETAPRANEDVKSLDQMGENDYEKA